ncbi:MAG: hypothetical protein ACRD3E_12890 [Terriglobales bacterium]
MGTQAAGSQPDNGEDIGEIDPLDELLMWAHQILECRSEQEPGAAGLYALLGEMDALVGIRDVIARIKADQ